MELGEPTREIEVMPREDPVPREQPEQEQEPVRKPAREREAEPAPA